MKKFISKKISVYAFGILAFGIILYMLQILFSLKNDVEKLEREKSNLEEQVLSYTHKFLETEEKLMAAEDQNIADSSTIVNLRNAITAKDNRNIELESMIDSMYANLFEQYFGYIEFSDGLDYSELTEIDKQYAISNNAVNSECFAKKLELNKTLTELINEALQNETDETKQIVLRTLISDLQEDYDFLLPFYEQAIKEQKELKEYYNVVPMPEE